MANFLSYSLLSRKPTAQHAATGFISTSTQKEPEEGKILHRCKLVFCKLIREVKLHHFSHTQLIGRILTSPYTHWKDSARSKSQEAAVYVGPPDDYQHLFVFILGMPVAVMYLSCKF